MKRIHPKQLKTFQHSPLYDVTRGTNPFHNNLPCLQFCEN